MKPDYDQTKAGSGQCRIRTLVVMPGTNVALVVGVDEVTALGENDGTLPGALDRPVDERIGVPVTVRIPELVTIDVSVLSILKGPGGKADTCESEVVADGMVLPPLDTVVKDEVTDDPAPSPPASNAKEHFFTSSTAGFPVSSVMGVSVTSHVSVNWPASLMEGLSVI